MDNLIKVTVNNIDDITPEKRHLVDELKIVGHFNSRTQISILKSMCNTVNEGRRTGGRLSVLDLSQSDIMGYYHGDWGDLIDCLTLRKVTFPSYIDRIFASTFSGCKSLEGIYIASGSRDLKRCYYIDIDGVLFSNNNMKLVLEKYPANKGTDYIVPEKTVTIRDNAFEDCQLTRLTMPPVPPTCDINAFKGVNIIAITLVVPKGSHDSYWLHPVFGKFQIEEMDE